MLHSRLSEPVFDSLLVRTQPILLQHHSLAHAAMVARPNWKGGQKPQGTGRVVTPSARQYGGTIERGKPWPDRLTGNWSQQLVASANLLLWPEPSRAHHHPYTLHDTTKLLYYRYCLTLKSYKTELF
jgi:hypothetical protein